MSKMREDFDKWYAAKTYSTPFAYRIADDAFAAGYQAAIAAIREGGAAEVYDQSEIGDCSLITGQYQTGTNLYRLPDDAP